MYGENQLQEKMPYHIEMATKMVSELSQLSHKEQVEAFDHIRKTIVEHRKMQAECIAKENEERGIDLNTHIEGTKHILAAF